MAENINTYNKEQKMFHVMICLIEIWTPEDKKKPLQEPKNPMLITEVGEIEIIESYRKLIGSAQVSFPRGTVVRTTVDDNNKDKNSTKVTATFSDTGVLEETRTSLTSVAKTTDFHPYDRIRIRLGYLTEEGAHIAEWAKTSNTGQNIFNNKGLLQQYKNHMDIMFDGYIVKVSLDTPIVLSCENFASALKSITCSKRKLGKDTVKSFLKSGYPNGVDILNGTGIILHPALDDIEYNLGDQEIDPDRTVADVLLSWTKYGVYSWMTVYDNQPALMLARLYFTKESGQRKDSVIDYAENPNPVEVCFNYHVAKNNLTLMSTDKKYLAVSAKCLDGKGKNAKYIHITVMRDPSIESGEGKEMEYRAVNETKLTKKQMKMGLRPLSESTTKVDMSLYTKIEYQSPRIPCTRDQLYEEAIAYLEGYNMNGIEGSLTLFGDLALHTATKIHLIDDRFPGKNGYYLVDEVHTTFGSGGYRQTIKLPYCIKRDDEETDKEQST